VAEENGSPRTIRVVDRRRFTVDGDPRSDVLRTAESAPDVEPPPVAGSDTARQASVAQPAVQPTVQPTAPPAAAEPVPQPRANQAGKTSPVFVELVATLAQQAELLLVGGEGLPAEPDQARRMIDYLAALESKTAGNLSPEEAEVLSTVVFQLRTLFIQGR
jgi:hypothetical protein